MPRHHLNLCITCECVIAGCIARRSRLREDFRAAWVCQLGRQGCFFKCPGGRWVSNGWLEVDDMLPLMEDIYKQAGVGTIQPMNYTC